MNSLIRFVHAVPKGPAVDLEINYDAIFKSVREGQVTKYKQVSATTIKFKLQVANSNQTVIFSEYNLKPNQAYSLIATGLLDAAEDEQDLAVQFILYQDHNTP